MPGSHLNLRIGRAGLVLLVAGLHLLGLGLLGRSPHRQGLPAPEYAEFTILPLAPVPRSKGPAVPDARTRKLAARAPREQAAMQQAVTHVEAPAPAPAAPATAQAPADSPALAERLVRLAGGVDRELRHGAPGVPKLAPDSPIERLRRGIEGAYRGDQEAFDVYTSPDGVTVTRVTRKGSIRCYISGIAAGASLSGLMSGKDSGQRSVGCPPPGENWRRRP